GGMGRAVRGGWGDGGGGGGGPGPGAGAGGQSPEPGAGGGGPGARNGAGARDGEGTGRRRGRDGGSRYSMTASSRFLSCCPYFRRYSTLRSISSTPAGPTPTRSSLH